MLFYLALILPAPIGAIFYFKEYGLQGLEIFWRWGIIRILFLGLYMAHVLIFFLKGEEWFCGICWGRAKMVMFVYPGIGYLLILFSPLIAGSVFHSNLAKLKEFVVAFWGFTLVAYAGTKIIFTGIS